MSRFLRLVLFIGIISVCQNSQSQLTANGNPIPRQVQSLSTTPDTPKKKIKALSIGDHVPDFGFSMLNYSNPSAKLSDFKGKLVILDFWGSWCYSCLHAIPKLDKLQKEFADKLQLIFVNSAETTGDTREKVIQSIKKYSNNSQLSFLVSYEDSIALKYFPHVYLPHYVWITPNGIVKAITEAEDVTEENIKAILENENVELSLPVKMDYFPNKLMDLGLEGQPIIDENLAHYSIFKKGKINGLSRIVARRELPAKDGEGQVSRGISLRNVPLTELFETAINYSKKTLNGELHKRIVLDIKDPSKFYFDPTKMSKEAWETDNLYTYDLIIPEGQMKIIDEFIWRDLNMYSGYSGRIESRILNCLVLTETEKAKFDPSKNGIGPSITIKDGVCTITSSSTESFTSVLDKNPRIKIPVINKTKKNIRFDISFDYDHFDLNKLNKQLAALGLQLKESIQQINVLVVSEK
jgi:thiol-disulfide isomerase/thioredoxin